MKSVDSIVLVVTRTGRGFPGLIRLKAVLFLCASLVILSGCEPKTRYSAASVPEYDPAEQTPGGLASVGIKPFASLMLPSANLPPEQTAHFHAGKALAHQPWVKAPTITDARDGLGPIYNARTCLACHVNGGRGEMPDGEERPIFSALVRISVPGKNRQLGAQPEPTYGLQIQGQSVSLQHQFRHHPPTTNIQEAAPEAYVHIDWQTKNVTYSDGEILTLRYPKLRFESLGYGPLSDKLQTSLRSAPAIAGLGLLELINQADIDALADAEDRDGDGISGRVNQIWDPQQQAILPGRFGWKANRASLATTVAAAFNQDVGISNPIFSEQPCTQAQPICQQMRNGNNAQGFEIDQALLDLVVDFTRNLAVPRIRTEALNPQSLQQGRELFYQIGCADCHHPSYLTVKVEGKLAHLGGQIIWPYTDLLLHDLGPGLADGRPDFTASGSEWRTPPLWAIGLNKQVNGNELYLHDGRAQSIAEAIVWHGGEAAASQSQFMHLTKTQRQAVVQFVESR